MGETIKEKKLNELDILQDIINPINSKEIKTKELATQLNVSEKELKKHIKDNGYIWQGNKYVKNVKLGNQSKVPKEEKQVEKVKVTYRIDKELHRMVKMQAIKEDTDNTDIIEKAIRNYISEAVKKTLKEW